MTAGNYTWSNYKHHNTLNLLVACSPCGAVTFVSRSFGGRASDKVITKKSVFLDMLEHGSVVLADRGFLIGEELAACGAALVIPDFTRGKTQLKLSAQRFRYALFALIHTQAYFEYYTLTLRLASLVKKAVIYAYWTKELFDICRENVSYMATLPSVARHVIHADNLRPRH